MQLDWNATLDPTVDDGWVLVANLPYNVATPLICDILDTRPARPTDDRDGAARGRRALRRPTAHARVRRGQRQGRVLGHGADRRPRARRRSSCHDRTSSRRSSRSPGARRRRHRPPIRRCCSLSCAPGSGNGARCCARSLGDLVDPEQFEAADVAPDRPRRGTRRGRVVPSRRRRRSSRPMSRRSITLRAHAKLTLSLHVTGVRDDGYHLHRRRDGQPRTPRPADVRDSPDGVDRRSTATGPFADGMPLDRLESRRPRARPRRARPHTCTIDKRIPHGGGLGGGSTDAATALRWAGAARRTDDLERAAALGADIPFCLVGGHARVRGIGEIVEPLAARRPRRSR